MSTSRQVVNRFTLLEPSLVDIIEPRYGLLEELIYRRVLTDREVSAIRDKSNIYKQNESLLQHLKDKLDDQFEPFLEALNKTDQQHVANWIKFNGRKFIVASFCNQKIIWPHTR
jgi:Caspase recruitment domain